MNTLEIKNDFFNSDGLPKSTTIIDAMTKCTSVLKKHNKILVSLSGGADSDIMLDLVERCKQPNNEIVYIWFDTGIEFDATKRHLDELEKKYNIEIKREKPPISVPASCRKYGVPIFSKMISEHIYRLQTHGFKWEDEDFGTLCSKYKNCKSSLRWWTNTYENGDHFGINQKSWLKEFIIANPPDFPISNMCCKYTKKDFAKKYKKNNEIDLSCVGIRKAEGGQRATIYKGCFTEEEDKANEYRPLFWFSNKERDFYKQCYELKWSDCYEVYGMPRTGCTGCPFSKDFQKELEIIDKFEPKLSVAVRNIFKKAYEYQEAYLKFRNEMNNKYKSYKSYLKERQNESN